MGRIGEEWESITDEELLGFQVQTPPPPPPPPPPPQTPVAPPPDEAPVLTFNYRLPLTSDPWSFFLRLIRHDLEMTIDWAAQAAGLPVYDAIVGLQERDPHLFAMIVMRGVTLGRYTGPRAVNFAGALTGARLLDHADAWWHDRHLEKTEPPPRTAKEKFDAIFVNPPIHVGRPEHNQPGKPSIEEKRAAYEAERGAHADGDIIVPSQVSPKSRHRQQKAADARGVQADFS